MSIYKKYEKLQRLEYAFGYTMTRCQKCKESHPDVFQVCPFCRAQAKPHIVDDATGNCGTCDFHKGMSNSKFRGCRIPGEYGKCTRPAGLCEPYAELKKQAA